MECSAVKIALVFTVLGIAPALFVIPRFATPSKRCLFVVPATTLAVDGITELERQFDEVWRIPPLPEDAAPGLGSRTDVCICEGRSCSYCRLTSRIVTLPFSGGAYAPSVRRRIGHWMLMERALNTAAAACLELQVVGLSRALRHPMLEIGKPRNAETQRGFSMSVLRSMKRFRPQHERLGLRHSACVSRCLSRTRAPAVVLHAPASSGSTAGAGGSADARPVCAVVGNSDSLVASGWGPAIDHHDVVVRINTFPLVLNRTDPGSTGHRLTHWYLNRALCDRFAKRRAAFAPFHDVLARTDENVTLLVAAHHVPKVAELVQDLVHVHVGLRGPTSPVPAASRSRIASKVLGATGTVRAGTSGMGVLMRFLPVCRETSVFGLSDGGGLLMPGEQPVRAGLTCLAALEEGLPIRCVFLRSEACTLSCLLSSTNSSRSGVQWTPAADWMQSLRS